METLQLSKPRVDYLKGLIIERMNALDLNYVDMASALNISTGTWFNIMRKDTTQWKLAHILEAGRLLGISIEDIRQAIRY